MEPETQAEELAKRVTEIGDARTGKETASRIQEAAQRESPLDEARRLNTETKELVSVMSKLKSDLEEVAAFNALSGRALANKQLTPEQVLKQSVDERAKLLTKNYIR